MGGDIRVSGEPGGKPWEEDAAVDDVSSCLAATDALESFNLSSLAIFSNSSFLRGVFGLRALWGVSLLPYISGSGELTDLESLRVFIARNQRLDGNCRRRTKVMDHSEIQACLVFVSGGEQTTGSKR